MGPLKVFFPKNIPHPVIEEHQAPRRGMLARLEVIFADIFFEFIFGPSFAVCPHLAGAAMCNVFGSGLIQNFSLIG